jgi:hypothetical protein
VTTPRVYGGRVTRAHGRLPRRPALPVPVIYSAVLRAVAIRVPAPRSSIRPLAADFPEAGPHPDPSITEALFRGEAIRVRTYSSELGLIAPYRIRKKAYHPPIVSAGPTPPGPTDIPAMTRELPDIRGPDRRSIALLGVRSDSEIPIPRHSPAWIAGIRDARTTSDRLWAGAPLPRSPVTRTLLRSGSEGIRRASVPNVGTRFSTTTE